MAKPVKREPKKPYSKPSLTVYGTIRELTQKVGTSGKRDGGRNPKKFATHV
jgi:hypothetical protein